MRTTSSAVALFMILVCLSVSQAMAGSKGMPAKLIGENYCLHCSLVMADNPDAKCGPETCSYALKVKSAEDEDGKPIKALEGVTLHYIKSEASAKLTDDGELFGKKVDVSGTVFVDERALNVDGATLHDEFADFDNLILDTPVNRASARR